MERIFGMGRKRKQAHDRLLKLVDEDTAAFNAIMDAFGLPKNNDQEKKIRSAAIQAATNVPLMFRLR